MKVREVDLLGSLVVVGLEPVWEADLSPGHAGLFLHAVSYHRLEKHSCKSVLTFTLHVRQQGSGIIFILKLSVTFRLSFFFHH